MQILAIPTPTLPVLEEVGFAGWQLDEPFERDVWEEPRALARGGWSETRWREWLRLLADERDARIAWWNELEAWLSRRGLAVPETFAQNRVVEAMRSEEAERRLDWNVAMRRTGWGEDLDGWIQRWKEAGVWQEWIRRIAGDEDRQDDSDDDIVRVVRMGKGHKDGKGKGARSRSPRRGMDGQSGMDGKDGMDGKGGKRGKSGVSGCKGGKTPLMTVAQAGIALDQEQVVSAQEARDILVAVQACTLASDRVGEATRVLAESVKAVDAEQARWLANFESVRRMVEARRARRQQLSESMLHLLESESD